MISFNYKEGQNLIMRSKIAVNIQKELKKMVSFSQKRRLKDLYIDAK